MVGQLCCEVSGGCLLGGPTHPHPDAPMSPWLLSLNIFLLILSASLNNSLPVSDSLLPSVPFSSPIVLGWVLVVFYLG